MTTFDEVNRRYGRESLQLAGAGMPNRKKGWGMKQDRRTPGYTTSWEEMPIARA